MIVELPNGEFAEFPDGMPQEQVLSIIQGQFPPKGVQPPQQALQPETNAVSPGTQAAVERAVEGPPFPGPPTLGQKALEYGLKGLEYANIPFKPLDIAREKIEQGVEHLLPGITQPQEVPVEAIFPEMLAGQGSRGQSGMRAQTLAPTTMPLITAETAAIGPYTRSMMSALKQAPKAVRALASVPEAVQGAVKYKGPALPRELDIPAFKQNLATGKYNLGEQASVQAPPTEPVVAPTVDIQSDADRLAAELMGTTQSSAAIPPGIEALLQGKNPHLPKFMQGTEGSTPAARTMGPEHPLFGGSAGADTPAFMRMSIAGKFAPYRRTGPSPVASEPEQSAFAEKLMGQRGQVGFAKPGEAQHVQTKRRSLQNKMALAEQEIQKLRTALGR